MTRKAQDMTKSVAAGVIAGGLAFMAVKTVCGHRSFKGMSAAKAFKMIGSLMDNI